MRSPLDLTHDVDKDRESSHRQQRPPTKTAREDVRDLASLKVLASGLEPADEQRDPAGGDKDEAEIQREPRRSLHDVQCASRARQPCGTAEQFANRYSLGG